ncbi:MAG: N-acetylmuramoyl-L-alanine amidase [Eubacteriales bacterium]|nr:N-acetylmuramoyl-L-alanine amidase [Eubacteriales bacterium]
MKKKKIWTCIFLAAVMAVTGISGTLQTMAQKDTRAVKKHVVVLDPGHGGGETGARATYNGVTYKEEEINWKISNYTMQELAKQSDIEVHLTRTYTQSMGLRARVQTAKNYGADILVSQHINSVDSPSAKGASVMISKGTYRSYLAAKEKLFGSYVMDELGKLGIYKRFPETGGMEYRMSENGSKYPNGKPRDYYGIVASSIEMDLPGVIIEHAFISNYSDVKNFLSTDAKLKKLAQADARAIIRYCNQLPDEEVPGPDVDPDKKNGWIKENGDYYYYENGEKAVNRLLFLIPGIYYVDEEGKRQYGWQEFEGKTYFFKDDGIAHCNWMNDNGTWYYFNQKYGYLYKDIALVSGAGNVYLFDKDGKRLSGWCTFKGKRYYVGEKGYALRGMRKVNGKYYYFDPTKAYLYTNKKITMKNGDIYYVDNKGVRYDKGFKTLKSGTKTYTYFFQKNGIAKKGWMKLNGKWYYFTSKARVMLKSTTVTNSKGKVYKFNSKGICTNRK